MKARQRDLVPYLRLFGPYKAWLAGGIALSVTTLAGSLGLLGLAGGFLTAAALAGLVPAAAQVFDVISPSGGIRLFALMRTASRWSERVVNHEATFRFLASLRVRLYESLSRLSPRQLGLWHGGELLNRLTRDIDLLDNLFIRLLAPIAAALIVLGALVTVGFVYGQLLGWLLAGLAFAGLVLIPLGAFVFSRKLSPRQVEQHGRLRSRLLDLFDGLEEWSLHRPSWEIQRNRALEADQERLKDHRSLQNVHALSRAAVVSVVGLAAGLTMFVGASALENLDPAWFVGLTLLVLGSGEALLTLPAAWSDLPGTILAAHRLSQLSGQTPVPAFSSAWDDPLPAPLLRWSRLGFAYDPEEPVLKNLRGELEPGRHVALLGPSGGGKTTLVRLLSRLEDPTEGNIILGGRDLAAWSEPSLRTMISCVSQDPWSFSETLGDNLRLADPEAADEALWEVLEIVGLAETVRAWPEGLATWVEEGGQSLSGGQRRRLALARGLLRRAPITILDEPTEGLDEAAATELAASIRRTLAGKTLLWITHRPEGLSEFDEVWTLTPAPVPDIV